LTDADVERIGSLVAEIAEIKGRAHRNQQRRELKARLDELGSEH
jgi:phosphate uptake regulator